MVEATSEASMRLLLANAATRYAKSVAQYASNAWENTPLTHYGIALVVVVVLGWILVKSIASR